MAKRPLIVAGGGANRSGAGPAITAFAERLSMPVVSTITGQGVIRDDHALAIGIIGDNGFHPHAIEALQESDLQIYVGCRMRSVATASRLAEVFGIRSFRIETGVQLEAALADAFACNDPCFLDIVVESIADRLPPVMSWLKKVGMDPTKIAAQAQISPSY